MIKINGLFLPHLTFAAMNKAIADIRKEYASETLLESDVAAHPMQQFQSWWDQVLASQIDEPNAMTLATASADGRRFSQGSAVRSIWMSSSG